MSEPTIQSEGVNAGQAIPRSVFDTSILPQRSAIENWQEQLEPICEAQLGKDSDIDFHARVESFVLDKIAIGDMQITAQAFDRSRFLIAATMSSTMCCISSRGGAWFAGIPRRAADSSRGICWWPT